MFLIKIVHLYPIRLFFNLFILFNNLRTSITTKFMLTRIIAKQLGLRTSKKLFIFAIIYIVMTIMVTVQFYSKFMFQFLIRYSFHELTFPFLQIVHILMDIILIPELKIISLIQKFIRLLLLQILSQYILQLPRFIPQHIFQIFMFHYMPLYALV